MNEEYQKELQYLVMFSYFLTYFLLGDNKMKKILYLLLLLCLWIPIINAEETVDTTENSQNNITENNEESNIDENTTTENNNSESSSLNLASNAKSAIMIEASTGKIIYEKNSDEQLPMASMTKMMTLLLIMENIETGNLKWDELVTASEHAASMGGSQIFLEVGEQMTVEDLVKGICIGSGNDLAVI